jgi:hypothetical protein
MSVSLFRASDDGDQPWSADIIAVLPPLISTCPGSICAAASCGRWNCVGKRTTNGTFNLHVWHASLDDAQLQDPIPVLSLTNERFNSNNASASSLFIAMETNHTNSNKNDNDDAIYLYALSGDTLCLWKLTRSDIVRSVSTMTTSGTTPPSFTSTTALLVLPDHATTGLSVTRTATTFLILVTTARHVYYVSQTKAPVSLQAHVVQPHKPQGYLTFLTSAAAAVVQTPVLQAIGTGPDSFLTCATHGTLQFWTVTRATGGAPISFHPTAAPCKQVDISKLLQDDAIQSLQLLPTVAVRGRYIHAIGLSKHSHTEEPLLHWIVLERNVDNDNSSADVTLVRSIWLNRFVHTRSIVCHGILLADNGLAYAAFDTADASPVVFMCLTANGDLEEIDIYQGSILSFTKDVVTHGCCAWTSQGVCMRVRLVQEIKHTLGTSMSPSAVNQLALHLQSSFWDAYEHAGRSVRVPPSLELASIEDMEQAIIKVAQLLHQDNNSMMTAAYNPMERHEAFLLFLQEGGLYRSISTLCRWKIMAIGQQVAVYCALRSRQPKSEWESQQLKRLTVFGVADWLDEVRMQVLVPSGDPRQHDSFFAWFCLSLKEATVHRYENLAALYDITSNVPPQVESEDLVPLWTCHLDTYQQVLYFWKDHLASVSNERVEVFVRTALESYRDAYVSCANPSTRERYAKNQTIYISFFRQACGHAGDEVALCICLEHHNYSKVCQIAIDHERKSDRNHFALEPFFETFKGQRDFSTNLEFSVFALKWLADNNRVGHSLKYGKLCPKALRQLVDENEALRPHQWIQATSNGDYNTASFSLMANSMERNLAQAKLHLSFASIANTLWERESFTHKQDALKRGETIEKKRELAKVQTWLFEKENRDHSGKQQLWSADKLLEYVLAQFDKCTDREKRIYLSFLGLAVCAASDSMEDSAVMAAQVWSKVILQDKDLFDKWMQSQTNLADESLRKLVRESTLVGGLMNRCSEMTAWDHVLFGNRVEAQVMDLLFDLDATYLSGLRRILRNAIQPIS